MKKINDTSSISGGSEYRTLRGFRDDNPKDIAVMYFSDNWKIAFNPFDENQIEYLNKYKSNPLGITHDDIVELDDSEIKYYTISDLPMLLSKDRSAHANF